jgi:hypothetical protein
MVYKKKSPTISSSGYLCVCVHVRTQVWSQEENDFFIFIPHTPFPLVYPFHTFIFLPFPSFSFFHPTVICLLLMSSFSFTVKQIRYVLLKTCCYTKKQWKILVWYTAPYFDIFPEVCISKQKLQALINTHNNSYSTSDADNEFEMDQFKAWCSPPYKGITLSRPKNTVDKAATCLTFT